MPAKSPAKSGAPRTIKEYKEALLRLDVALPLSTAKLADYEKLYEGAVRPPAKRRASTGTPAASRRKTTRE